MQQPGLLTATDGGVMQTDRDRGAIRGIAYPGGIAYPDCVIAVMPDGGAGLRPEEISALRALAAAGLVPPLPRAAGSRAAGPLGTGSRAAGSRAGSLAAGSRGTGSRPAAARPSVRKSPSHPQLKPHNPRPALRKDRQDPAESRRTG
jgi:hypothetical protein